MKFLEALEALKEPRAFGMFRAKNPTNVIYWDSQSAQFKTFYTHKVVLITQENLFANDWDIVMIPPTPEEDFTQEPENER